VAEPTLGELVQRASKDMSELVRKEIELAKVEIKTEVVAAVKGAGALGAAGMAGLLGLLFLSAGAAFGIGEALGAWAGFLIIGAVYLVAAGVLVLAGKKRIDEVGPPEKTIETVKDDMAWARHPTRGTEEKQPVS
jgi:hypothetical protein